MLSAAASALVTLGLTGTRVLLTPDARGVIFALAGTSGALWLAAALARRLEAASRWLMPLAGLVGTTCMALAEGGLSSEAMYWLPLVPLVGTLLLNRAGAVTIAVLSVLATGLLFVRELPGGMPPDALLLRWFGLSGAVVFGACLGLVYEYLRERAATQLETARRQTQDVVKHLTAGVVVTDADQRVISLNDELRELLPAARGDTTQARMWDLLDEEKLRYPDEIADLFEELVRLREEVSGRVISFRDGSHLSLDFVPIPGGQLLWTLRDVTREKSRERELVERVSTDELTGLGSRDLLLASLEDACARLEPLSLLYVDLDGFKQLNDTHGHEAGDKALRIVGDRLRAAVRLSDLAARVGGDEFAVLLEGPGAATAAPRVAEALLASISEPIVVDGVSSTLGASIGIAYGKGAEPDALLKAADEAMYRAKRAGGHRVVDTREESTNPNARAPG